MRNEELLLKYERNIKQVEKELIMKKHYIYEYTREELIEFHGDGSLCIMNDEFILNACIERLLSDSDADDKYEMVEGILYEKA